VRDPRRAGPRAQVHRDGPHADRAGQGPPAHLVHAHDDPRPGTQQGPLVAQVHRRRTHGPPGSGTPAKVASGLRRTDQRSSGHTVVKATPTTLASGTKPSPVLAPGNRESPEFCRLSPSTNSAPSGTTTSNGTSLGRLPGLR